MSRNMNFILLVMEIDRKLKQKNDHIILQKDPHFTKSPGTVEKGGRQRVVGKETIKKPLQKI